MAGRKTEIGIGRKWGREDGEGGRKVKKEEG